ncbi:hypothetical protein ACIQU4_40970 [Streptomyces sp. NPDC090741]|uniref:hypothetical protein n=1 Tax=Streptomyces sp. NPDC090741 TaxID=3365967 RepID=UPI003803213E
MTWKRHARNVEQFLQCALDALRGDLDGILDAEQILATALQDPADEQGIVSWVITFGWAERAVDGADGSSPMIRLTPLGVARAQELRDHPHSRADRETYLHYVLPRWAYQSARSGDWASLQTFAACDQWWFRGAAMTWGEVDAAVSYLEDKGILKVQRAPGVNATHIAPTAAGIDFVLSKKMLRTFMTNQRPDFRADRETYLHNVLPRWAYQSARSGDWASLQTFAACDQWWFRGAAMTWGEVDAAVSYLEDKGILKVQRAPGANATHIAPTAEGIDFVLSKKMLRTFMTNQRPATQRVTNYYGNNSNYVHGDAPGSNLATGGGNTQTVNQGIDAQGLAALVAQLRAIAPNLGLSPQDAEDFNQDIDELERDGADPQSGGRIFRRLLRMVPPELVAAGTDQGLAATIAFGTSLFGG